MKGSTICANCGQHSTCTSAECRAVFRPGTRFLSFCLDMPREGTAQHQAWLDVRRSLHPSYRHALRSFAARSVYGERWRIVQIPPEAVAEFGAEAWDFDGFVISDLRCSP